MRNRSNQLASAPRVAAEQRFIPQLVRYFIGGLLHLESSTDEDLKLTDGLNGNLSIYGGFDTTPVDGTGALFNFSAVAIPEPAGIALVATAALSLFGSRCCRFPDNGPPMARHWTKEGASWALFWATRSHLSPTRLCGQARSLGEDFVLMWSLLSEFTKFWNCRH